MMCSLKARTTKWGVAMTALFLAAAVAAKPLSDKDIAAAVTQALFTADGVHAHLIDTTVDQQVVTLSGTVDNLLAKERATEVAQRIKGVRSVVNRITVAPVQRADVEILEDITAALVENPATEGYDVSVDVSEGAISLGGRVQSHQEKALAGMIAKGVKGVREVNNRITVETVDSRPDRQLERDIEGRLAADMAVDDKLIKVEVKDGKAVLTGAVGSAWEKARAANDARIRGIREVDVANLEVKFDAREEMRRKEAYRADDDQKIIRAIEAALEEDPRVREGEITVDVSGGDALLSGTVRSLPAKQAAAEAARHTVGVWRVRNLVKVRPDEIRNDRELTQAVAKALRRDPYLAAEKLDVRAQNARVVLGGDVDSRFEKDRAGQIAAQVKGVVDIENHLDFRFAQPDRPDQMVKADIERELTWSPFVDPADVDVTVEDQIATLTGTVKTMKEYEAAEENAYQGGAKGVRNRLRIEYAPWD